MKKKFQKYYDYSDEKVVLKLVQQDIFETQREILNQIYPSNADKVKLFKEAEVAFDTNVLIELYDLPYGIAERFFAIAEKFKGRLWLPYKVGEEYSSKFHKAISNRVASFEGVQRSIAKLKSELIDRIGEDDKIQEAIATLAKLVEVHGKESDSTCSKRKEAICSLFENAVGEPYLEKEMEKKEKEAAERLSEKLPPGYKDGNKDNNNLGDVLIWLQLIDRCLQTKRPLIFVTNDQKQDWWLKNKQDKDKNLGPRPELIVEMKRRAGVGFYMYSLPEFLKRAGKFAGLEDKAELQEELEKFEQEQTELRRRTEDMIDRPSMAPGVMLAKFDNPGSLPIEFPAHSYTLYCRMPLLLRDKIHDAMLRVANNPRHRNGDGNELGAWPIPEDDCVIGYQVSGGKVTVLNFVKMNNEQWRS